MHLKLNPNIMVDDFEVNGVNKKDISNTELKYSENNMKIASLQMTIVNTKSNSILL